MGIVVHNDRITPKEADALMKLCPFGAFSYEKGELSAGPACRMCRLCVKNGPPGAVTFEEEKTSGINKDLWRGIAVYAEYCSRGKNSGRVHPVSLELLGKARELASVTGHPVYALLIGSGTGDAAEQLLEYGADAVYVYDNKVFTDFIISPFAATFTDFIQKVKPSSILVGATSRGRSLAPKVAARVRAGLTADCTMLEMKENTDLVQIRPAFGGNIMARIVTPGTRPQFCTVRYKIFSAPEKQLPHGRIVMMDVTGDMLSGSTEIISILPKPEEIDISDAEVIVAVGRGLKSKDDIRLASDLAKALGAQLACTRPLVEAGWFDPRRQIGLSGRTVKPKLIITLGISGSVQFAAGMRNSDVIIAVNSDRNAPIFSVAHRGFVGDLYGIVPKLLEKAEEYRNV
ncbi:MAG: FAD-binding protein [Clostridia bacterium]|nr:FAD-binding protein [Clostridia bacterium]